MGFLYVVTSLSAMAASGAAIYAALAHRRVADLKVTVDGRMGQLLEATQALGREEGRALAEVHEHIANGDH